MIKHGITSTALGEIRGYQIHDVRGNGEDAARTCRSRLRSSTPWTSRQDSILAREGLATPTSPIACRRKSQTRSAVRQAHPTDVHPVEHLPQGWTGSVRGRWGLVQLRECHPRYVLLRYALEDRGQVGRGGYGQWMGILGRRCFCRQNHVSSRVLEWACVMGLSTRDKKKEWKKEKRN